MSQTFTKFLLNGSTNGKQIKISGTASGSANTIHTAVSGTSSLDEIWIYCYNSDSTARSLTLLWGGTTEPDNQITISIPPLAGRVLVCDGMLLQNSLIVKAYASLTNVLLVDGFVNQIV
jgi:hypothetical protein